MNILKELASGLALSFLSFIILLGSVSASLAESNLLPVSEQATIVFIIPTGQRPTSTPSPSATGNAIPTIEPTQTQTSYPSSTPCPMPPGWETYVVLDGDTLAGLAEQRQASLEEIYAGNCLLSRELIPGSILFLPPIPLVEEVSTSTHTQIPCGPPAGWVQYTVQPNDSLYFLSVSSNVSIYQLQMANCMGSSTLIYTGQVIYVPPFQVPVFTRTPSSTPVPTETSTVVIPTSTSTAIPTITDTGIPVEIPSNTPESTDSPEQAPAVTEEGSPPDPDSTANP